MWERDRLYLEIIKDILDEIMDATFEDDVEQSWIPCEEALPHNNEIVIGSLNYDGFRYIGMVSFCENKWYSVPSGEEIGDEVMAWMPTPEPYEE